MRVSTIPLRYSPTGIVCHSRRREYLFVANTRSWMELAQAKQNRDREGARQIYLITRLCYGTRLPGQSGSVPRTRTDLVGLSPSPIPMSNSDLGAE